MTSVANLPGVGQVVEVVASDGETFRGTVLQAEGSIVRLKVDGTIASRWVTLYRTRAWKVIG